VTSSNKGRNKSARQLATEILVKVDTRKAYADILLDHSLKGAALPDRDRALLTELIYGTLRWRGHIDGRLAPRLHRPLADTDPLLRNLLRVTFYQLLFLDKIPGYAAVNEAVEIAKVHGPARGAAFVNGVLRNFLREKSRKPGLQPTNGSMLSLAIEHSHPDWLVNEWVDYFGVAEAEDLMRANNERPPVVLRVNSRRATRQALLDLLKKSGVSAAPTRWSPQGIWLREGSAVDRLPGFEAGLFQVQGEASQLVPYLLSPCPGERILDACAAPGGKTTRIAEIMGDSGQLTALDSSERGIEKIRENMTRLGLTSIGIVRGDATRELAAALRGPYDRILVDAPCSGLGTLRSHPEIKWHRDNGDIERLSRLQLKIVNRLASYLKTGGALVYSTCTLTQAENEQVTESFLTQHKEFELEDAAGYLPEEARSLVRGSYFMALPHRHNTDGFFAARMRKVGQ
jgi:16S rRNA (cytosine967-C5)-methyltransferase